MSRAARKLVEEFAALPKREQAEVLSELLRPAPLLPHEMPDDATLTEAADELFSELDRAEKSK